MNGWMDLNNQMDSILLSINRRANRLTKGWINMQTDIVRSTQNRSQTFNKANKRKSGVNDGQIDIFII